MRVVVSENRRCKLCQKNLRPNVSWYRRKGFWPLKPYHAFYGYHSCCGLEYMAFEDAGKGIWEKESPCE